MRFLEHVLDRALTKTVPVVSSESSTCVCERERKRERDIYCASHSNVIKRTLSALSELRDKAICCLFA